MSKPTNALEEARVLATNAIEVRRDGVILVGRTGEIGRKPSAREAGCHLGVHLSRTTDSRDEGALKPSWSKSCEFVIENHIKPTRRRESRDEPHAVITII
jgi:hypothetical protein